MTKAKIDSWRFAARLIAGCVTLLDEWHGWRPIFIKIYALRVIRCVPVESENLASICTRLMTS